MFGLGRRTAAPVARIEPRLAAPETCGVSVDMGPGWAGLSALSVGGYASPHFAENIGCVTACVNSIAAGIATLPDTVYQTIGAGRVESPNHPVSRLIRQPNEHQTCADWLEFSLSEVLLRGNSLSAVERDGAGRPVALRPIPWASMTVVRLPSGQLGYDISPGTGRPGMRRLLERDVWHLKDRSSDGLVGRSRLSRAPAVIDAAHSLQAYSEAVWQNAATPSGLLTVPTGIKPEGMARLRNNVDQLYSGVHNARRIMLVDNDIKWQSPYLSSEDAEVTRE